MPSRQMLVRPAKGLAEHLFASHCHDEEEREQESDGASSEADGTSSSAQGEVKGGNERG